MLKADYNKNDNLKNYSELFKIVKDMNKHSIIKIKKIRLRKLIDRWSLGVFILFVFVKLLQMLKKMGFASKQSGWRSAVRVYLSSEHSKFTLAAFHLDLWSDNTEQQNINYSTTKIHVIKRLQKFLSDSPASHWQIQWNRFTALPLKKRLIDIVHAEFNTEGDIISITPYLDDSLQQFQKLSTDYKMMIHSHFITYYNQLKNMNDHKRPHLLRRKLQKYLFHNKRIPDITTIIALGYIHRLLSATYITFEELPSTLTKNKHVRFDDPLFIRQKHPGFGLLNIVCRFNASHDEVDLWIQFNHIPVDGVPMQEMVQSLKQEWGTKKHIVFPGIATYTDAQPVLCSTDSGENGIYTLRTFIDFQNFLLTRKNINTQYVHKIGDSITAVSMLIWGLAHHTIFHNKKFLFTVELSECPVTKTERAPSVVMIRPSQYFDQQNPRNGFLNFQIEFNRRLRATRSRRSESYELLEIYALTSPFIYWLTQKLLPSSLAEFIGTVGITMIKDADLFSTPMSDIHTDGFIAFGNFSIPTEDGQYAGSVSVRGVHDKVIQYVDAIKSVVNNIEQYI